MKATKYCNNTLEGAVMGWERRMEEMKKTPFTVLTDYQAGSDRFVSEYYRGRHVDRIGLKSCPDTMYHISAAGTLNSVNYLVLQQK
jgi:hypothetical protein